MFIVFEGIDGSGKTTQAAKMAAWLTEQGRNALLACDPGHTEVGKAIRALLKDKHLHMEPLTQTLLFAASRSELASQVRRHLDADADVVADRWDMSTMVYQGYVQGIRRSLISYLTENCNYNITPELHILLDLDPAVATARLTQRAPDLRNSSPASSEDRYESQGLEFRTQLRQGYLEEAATRGTGLYWSKVVVVDASGDPDALHEEIRKLCAKKIPEFRALQQNAAAL